MIRNFSDFTDSDLVNQLVVKAKMIEATHYLKSPARNKEKEKET